MTKTELLVTMKKLQACDEATEWVMAHDALSAAMIWENCPNASWMMWLYKRAEPDQTRSVRVACAIARTALKYVPDGEKRPELCIEIVEMWLDDRATVDEVRSARDACLDYRYAAYAANAANAAGAAANAAYAGAYATYAAANAAYAGAYAANAAYAGANAAANAAYAAANGDADARKKSLEKSANIIREFISWSDIEAGL